jgi:CBS-domain-containing membrane protein
MRYVRAFASFWWDFVVGDDWRVAAGVAAGLALTAAFQVWWLLPPVVAVVLFASLARASRA